MSLTPYKRKSLKDKLNEQALERTKRIEVKEIKSLKVGKEKKK